ncbi:RNA polymerase-binding protein RbpA [Bogoriella caseilytica]|uniref:RNA polymerase-binding protein RbpA n=1 Tax=Bogoriella caseilytica TaxID=56055 RepID=A0A3N2BGQ5_9MICO|nr:RNA polymerase-binding protein RbpA [Bogoriella caseilytica]ROR74408.1 RNA polymerase binding protein RbpA [Bogoriella caseilytica]
MAERSLRGMKIGANSLESEDGVDFAPRMMAYYSCPDEHSFELPFSVDAELPPVWECKVCGKEALLKDASKPEPKKPIKPPRTHWDMLLERRSVPELESLLEERLELLRSGELRGRRSA